MDDGEDAVKRVVGRDAVVELETESIPKPILLGFGELNHADEVVGPANGGADDDEDDVHEVVDAFELDAWVTEFGEVIRQRSRGGGHDNAPDGWSGTLSDPTRECARAGVKNAAEVSGTQDGEKLIDSAQIIGIFVQSPWRYPGPPGSLLPHGLPDGDGSLNGRVGPGHSRCFSAVSEFALLGGVEQLGGGKVRAAVLDSRGLACDRLAGCGPLELLQVHLARPLPQARRQLAWRHHAEPTPPLAGQRHHHPRVHRRPLPSHVVTRHVRRDLRPPVHRRSDALRTDSTLYAATATQNPNSAARG